jgi:hypothetical protein
VRIGGEGGKGEKEKRRKGEVNYLFEGFQKLLVLSQGGNLRGTGRQLKVFQRDK